MGQQGVRFGAASNRRRRRDEQPRRHRYTVRLSDAEHEQVLANAAAARLSVAAYLAESALAPQRPAELVGSTYQQVLLRELMGLHRQLRGAATNLNQAVAKLHSVGTRADELAAAAAEVTRLARAVDDAVAQVCRARLPRQSSARARSGQPNRHVSGC